MDHEAHSLVTTLTELPWLCNESAELGVCLIGMFVHHAENSLFSFTAIGEVTQSVVGHIHSLQTW
jgi:hypothetical protein